MTPEDLQHIREATDKATPEPWQPIAYDDDEPTSIFSGVKNDKMLGTVVILGGVFQGLVRGVHNEEDAYFIANARTWIPQLLDYIDVLKEKQKMAAEIHSLDQQIQELQAQLTNINKVFLPGIDRISPLERQV